MDLESVIMQENCSKPRPRRALTAGHLQVLTGSLSRVSHREEYALHERILSKGSDLEDMQKVGLALQKITEMNVLHEGIHNTNMDWKGREMDVVTRQKHNHHMKCMSLQTTGMLKQIFRQVQMQFDAMSTLCFISGQV